VFQLSGRGSFPLPQLLTAHAYLLFYLLAGLPEEQVGRNCRPQDCYQGRQELTVEAESRYERPFQNLSPCRTREQGGDYVGQQRQREPFEDFCDQSIGSPNLQYNDGHSNWNDQRAYWYRNQHIDGGRNRADVGSCINSVRDYEAAHCPVEQFAGIVTAQHARQSHAADHSHFCADVLDGRHQRKGDNRRPKNTKAKRGTGDSVRSDPRRVVVGCSGNQSGSQYTKESSDKPGTPID